jgi:peptide/nickel transport system permease protein
MGVMEVLLTVPTLILALGLVAALGSSLGNVMIAVGVTLMPRFARLVRSEVLSERERDYVLAARALGGMPRWILFKHILPNTTSSIIVLATLRIASAIIMEASLSYLGLGTEYGYPTWGCVISGGQGYLRTAPWISIFPGLAIMFTVLGFSLMGDGLREALDPQLWRSR